MEKRVSFAGNSPLTQNSAVASEPSGQKIFLLSPANLKGIRGQRLLDPDLNSELGARLWQQGVPLAEFFCYTSSLYFRGKLAYAQLFSQPPAGLQGFFIITSSSGLLTPDTVVDIAKAKDLASGFFVNYHQLSGKEYRILDVRGPKEVQKRIKDGMRGAKRKAH